MIGRMRRLGHRLRESYWFLPTLQCAAAAILAFLLTTVDARGWLNFDEISWLIASEPEGARSMLSTIAGSMITVAGVAFSVTLVALATAAGNYGPRLLNLYLSDRAVQASLGAFCATYLYCILVLRLVGTPSGSDSVFVPQAALLGALGMAVVSLGVFIFFIHHVAQSIQVAEVVRRAAVELSMTLETPRGFQASPPPLVVTSETHNAASFVSADRPGYVLQAEVPTLVRIADEVDAVVELVRPLGSFVSRGVLLARVYSNHGIDDAVLASVRAALPLSGKRSAAGDPDFFIDQLVQIAARALSPGVNDPFTATTCIHALEGALSTCDLEPSQWLVARGEDESVRVVTRNIDFGQRLRAAHGTLIPYAVGDALARRELTKSLDRLLEGSTDPERSAAVAEQIRAVDLQGTVSSRAARSRHSSLFPL